MASWPAWQSWCRGLQFTILDPFDGLGAGPQVANRRQYWKGASGLAGSALHANGGRPRTQVSQMRMAFNTLQLSMPRLKSLSEAVPQTA